MADLWHEVDVIESFNVECQPIIEDWFPVSICPFPAESTEASADEIHRPITHHFDPAGSGRSQYVGDNGVQCVEHADNLGHVFHFPCLSMFDIIYFFYFVM